MIVDLFVARGPQVWCSSLKRGVWNDANTSSASSFKCSKTYWSIDGILIVRTDTVCTLTKFIMSNQPRSSSLNSLFYRFSLLFCREQRLQFKELVEVKFHKWLLETGHRRELDSLIPPPTNVVNQSESGRAADAEQGRTGEVTMAS